MLDQDFAAHQDQDEASGQLGFCLVSDAKQMACSDSDDGECEGNKTNEDYGGHNLYLKEGKGYANGQRINAGGNGQNDHSFCIHGGVQIVLQIFGKCLFYHVKTDYGQENEGNPVIHGGDGVFKTGAEIVAEKRHTCLKTAEIEADNNGMGFLELWHGETLTDGDGKGIHGEADSNEKKLDQ